MILRCVLSRGKIWRLFDRPNVQYMRVSSLLNNSTRTVFIGKSFEHTSSAAYLGGSRYHARMNDKSMGERLKKLRNSHPKISTYELAAEAKYITAAGITNK